MSNPTTTWISTPDRYMHRFAACVLAAILSASICTGCGKSEESGQEDSETKQSNSEKKPAGSEQKQAEPEKPKAPVPGEKDYEKGEYAMEQGDRETAIKFFAKAAEQGHPEAMNILGVIKNQEQEYEEALAYFKQASELGSLNAMRNLAICYHNGLGCEANEAESFKLYLKMAESGDASAQNMVGVYYFSGEAVAQNDQEALKWFRKAVAQGDQTAQMNLGKCYLWGRGVEKNEASAFQCFEKAAKQGNEEAYYQMGLCYLNGLGVDRNESEAGACFRHAYNLIRKMEDTPDHQYELALACYSFYLNSDKELRDLKAKRAAREAGPWDYKLHDDLLDMDKQIAELQRDQMRPYHLQEYNSWLKKAAENGNPHAQYRMAEDSINPVVKKAWYKKAAEQGIMEANRELGKLYCDPWEKLQNNADSAEAKQWYEKAAEQGDVLSQYALARIYKEIEKDDAKAFTWYKKTAEHPFVEDDFLSLNEEEINSAILTAQYNLAKCYADGKGVEDDENEAFKWYKKVANCSLEQFYYKSDYHSTLASAYYELGVCYERGWGCSKSQSEAIRWYKLASTSEYYSDGKTKALKALERLGQK